jgi:23S rRNA pseudouridine2605 synthase
MKNRLSKVLASAGVASRRAAEEIIFDGQVTVNGKIELLPQTLVDLAVDRIEVDGVPVEKVEQKRYYMVNKPKGYICSSVRSKNHPDIALDLIDNANERLFTVGRLDKDSEGLLLITNDGHFANEVIHPRSEVEKEYLVKTNWELMPNHLKAISEGCEVEGVFIKPTSVKKVRKGTLKVVVMEGKKREVRELVKHAGLKVRELTRIRLGGLHLGSLPPGRYKSLTPSDRQAIFS